MTIRSPFASCSGPGALDTNAICLPSGDHEIESPDVGSGWFVPVTGAMNRAPLPSDAATIRPNWPPAVPKYAIKRPSGDQRGLEAVPLAGPSRDDCRFATLMIHTCEYGRPGRSLLMTE